MDWIDALNRMLAWIEEHLTTDGTASEAAQSCGYSPFYMQRIFGALTGMTVGDYLRRRRLSEAGVAVKAGMSVLEAALAYGYDTPESFEKAFRRFHGATPSAVKAGRASLRCMTPFHITIDMTGGSTMDYSIENKDAMAVIGLERRFRYDSAFGEIPSFWDEYAAKGLHAVRPGYLGVCVDDDDQGADFAYMIAGFDVSGSDPVPEGFVRRTIPAGTWACFTCHGAMPKALQKLNRQVFQEWLPGSSEWTLAHGMNIEWYDEGDMSLATYRSGIWIPVKKK